MTNEFSDLFVLCFAALKNIFTFLLVWFHSPAFLLAWHLSISIGSVFIFMSSLVLLSQTPLNWNHSTVWEGKKSVEYLSGDDEIDDAHGLTSLENRF